MFTTPRPIPDRRWPAAGGTLVIALALPVFLLAGWPIRAWGLAAVLWIAGEALAFALNRLPFGLDNLAASGMRGITMNLRVIGVMVVLIAVATTDRELGLAAALLYVAAYTVELGLFLLTFFAGGKQA